MGRAPLLAVLLMVAATAHALPQALLVASPHALVALPRAQLPAQLTAGPDGGTTLNLNQTGAASSVGSSPVTVAAHNTTKVTNKGASDVRIRLVLQTATGKIGDCVTCDVELRRGSTTSAQIRIVAGTVAQTQGAWESLNRTGAWGEAWHVFATAQRLPGSGTDVVTVKYTLEVAPPGGTSPLARQTNMTMTFLV